MPDQGEDAVRATVAELRDELSPALVTGQAADEADFTNRLNARIPIVIAFVLGLAFVLLVAAFRSLPLAAATIGLNVLSLGAAYGVISAVFQHEWAEGLLGFESNGVVTTWIPLFAFVILFGLSMDYTILVLERMREARRNGRSARRAACEGVAATGGTVTSAAFVMVVVFSVSPPCGWSRTRSSASASPPRSSSTRRSCAASRCRPRSPCSATAAWRTRSPAWIVAPAARAPTPTAVPTDVR